MSIKMNFSCRLRDRRPADSPTNRWEDAKSPGGRFPRVLAAPVRLRWPITAKGGPRRSGPNELVSAIQSRHRIRGAGPGSTRERLEPRIGPRPEATKALWRTARRCPLTDIDGSTGATLRVEVTRSDLQAGPDGINSSFPGQYVGREVLWTPRDRSLPSTTSPRVPDARVPPNWSSVGQGGWGSVSCWSIVVRCGRRNDSAVDQELRSGRGSPSPEHSNAVCT